MTKITLPRELVERLLDTNRNAVHMEDFKSLQSALSQSLTYRHRVAKEINQCDGCRSGLKLRGNIHYDSSGKAVMTCQKHKYEGVTNE